MAFPLTYHRITNSDFRPCSTRRSRSQLGLYVYTHCMISIHAEPSFERLRYFLGGDRPSQTARLTVSPRPDSWPQVRNPAIQGWYPKGDSAEADAPVSKSPTYPVHELPNLSIKLQ